MRSTTSSPSSSQTFLPSNYSDELEQIAQLEQEWWERQMYLDDDRGFYV